ncbi:hypothetical protein [Micromonospora narathiwatensis]|nr:hypothetical protein [Micromonospora narathiwatensis]
MSVVWPAPPLVATPLGPAARWRLAAVRRLIDRLTGGILLALRALTALT